MVPIGARKQLSTTAVMVDEEEGAWQEEALQSDLDQADLISLLPETLDRDSNMSDVLLALAEAEAMNKLTATKLCRYLPCLFNRCSNLI